TGSSSRVAPGFLPWAREDIAHPANRLDMFRSPFRVTQLLTNFADVHINAAIEWREFAAQHRIDQSLAGHHSAGLAQQYLQQIEFDRSQFDRIAGMPYRPSSRVQFNITNAQHFRLSCGLLSILRAPPDGADAGHEFTRIEGLGQVIVRANF